MKIDIQFDRPRDFNGQNRTYLVPFSIIGGTRIDDVDIVHASQSPGAIKKLQHKILAELSALLQIETYGRVLSNEQTPTGDKPVTDSKGSETIGGIDNTGGKTEAEGGKRPDSGRENTATDSYPAKEKIYQKDATQD